MLQGLNKILLVKAKELKDLMIYRQLTLSVAESCTGGEISSILTQVPGISSVFLGGVVAYTPFYKEHILEVPLNTIATFGTVSKEMAIELASHIRNLSESSIGVSVVCVLGPSLDEKGHFVGTIFVGISTARRVIVKSPKVPCKPRPIMKKIVALKTLQILLGVVNS